jgi:hypothetical protein
MNASLEQVMFALIAVIDSKGFNFVADTDKLAENLTDESATKPTRHLDGSLANKREAVCGLTNNGSRTVYIRDDISLADQVSVLAHECGHLWLHTQTYDDGIKAAATHDVDLIIQSPDLMMVTLLGPLGGQFVTTKGEIAAELVSYAVCKNFGFEDQEWTHGYVANYVGRLGPNSWEIVRDTVFAEAADAVKEILAEVHKQLALVPAA